MLCEDRKDRVIGDEPGNTDTKIRIFQKSSIARLRQSPDYRFCLVYDKRPLHVGGGGGEPWTSSPLGVGPRRCGIWLFSACKGDGHRRYLTPALPFTTDGFNGCGCGGTSMQPSNRSTHMFFRP